MRTISVAIILPLEIGRLANRRIFGNRENPTHARQPLLRVDKFSKLFDIRSGFDDPVVAGDACVERAGFDVASHFLRAHEQAFDFRIVDGRNVAARADADFPARATEEIDRRVLQAAFGDAEFQARSLFGLLRLRLGVSLLRVDFVGIECSLLDDLRCTIARHRTKEAAAVAFVANAGADRIDADRAGNRRRSRCGCRGLLARGRSIRLSSRGDCASARKRRLRWCAAFRRTRRRS